MGNLMETKLGKVDISEEVIATIAGAAAPLLGEHTEEVLKNILNYPDNKIED